jgi:DNA-binding SARP family transcriptional activator
MKSRIILFVLWGLIFFSQKSYTQNYGLEFASYSVQKDLRTGLNLNPHETYSFNTNFELSFNISLYSPEQIFGYVLRAILNDTLNIDIQLNYMSEERIISIVIGQQIYNFTLGNVEQKIYGGWEVFRLKFDLAGNKIVFFREGKAHPINFQFPGKVLMSFVFGAINTNRFITTDVPPMQLKNIQLYKKNKLIQSWPLDESGGNQAYDSVQRKAATILNPHWMKPGFSQWQLNRKFSFPGVIVSTFNVKHNEIYFIKKDSLLIYSLKNGRMRGIAFSNSNQVINLDSRIIMDYSSNSLYHYYLDTREFIKFDTVTRRWDHVLSENSNYTRNFTQHNSFFSKRDSSLYFLGGYGFYKYKNAFFRYHIPSHTFSEVTLKGDRISPRYLSALGASRGYDSIYVLGGYGSVSGDQRINPQSYKDLYLITIKDGKSKKLFNLSSLPDDYCFAHSLVVSPEEKSYYALCFTKFRYRTWLKLIKGSFESAHFDNVGDSIPYLFEDVKSNADLYYLKDNKALVCTTSIFDDSNDSTHFEIYTINFPPNILPEKVMISNGSRLFGRLVLIFVAGLIILLAIGIVVRRRSKIKTEPGIEFTPEVHEEENMTKPIPSISGFTPAGNESAYRNAIFFFGEFRIFDHDGIEISQLFSPLVKELFLLIFFHSQKQRKGISTEMLNQMLWFDKNSSQARNNRSVNMSKLRHVTEKIEGLSLSKKEGYWIIEIQSDKLKIDYLNMIKYITAGRILPEKINDFLSLIKRGSFLAETNYEWLDKIKGEFTNDILDLLFAFEKSNKVNHDLMVKIADAIFIHDSLNEVALKFKYNALIAMGRHHLAKTVLEQFKVEYLSLYGEQFDENISANFS